MIFFRSQTLRPLFLSLIYFGISLPFLFSSVSDANVASIGLATGIAVYYGLIYGTQIWWGIFLGAFASHFFYLLISKGLAWSAASGGGLIAALSASVAFVGISYFFKRKELSLNLIFSSIRYFLQFIVILLLGSTVASLIGGFLFIYASSFFWGTYLHDLSIWFSGNLIGCFLMLPFLFYREELSKNWGQKAWRTELIVSLCCLFVVLLLSIFCTSFLPGIEILVFPVVFWIALRLGREAVSFNLLVLSLLASVVTILDKGPFVHHSPYSSFFSLQLFLGGLWISSFLFAIRNHEYQEEIEERTKRNRQARYLSSLLADRVIDRNDALEKINQKFVYYLEHLPLGYLELDCDKKIIAWNPQAEKFFGYTRDEVLGQNIVELLVPPQARQKMYELVDSVMRNGVYKEYVDENLTKSGEIIVCDWYNTPLFDKQGNLVSSMCLFRDVTSQKEFEDTLLESKLEAETANRSKSIFLSNMSHEIRTPLNTIIGMADILKNSLKNQEDKLFVQSIYDSGEALLNLMNNILEISKIEMAQNLTDLRRFRLADLIQDLTSIVGPRALSKSLNFHTTVDEKIPCVIYSDPLRLKQILISLIDNAIKFTEKGNIELSVTLQPAERSNSLLLSFKVIDSGVGIAEEDLPRLFKPFQQLDDSLTKKYNGSGLGLFLCNMFVRQLNGTLSVRSQLQQGSTFEFSLPIPEGALFNSEEEKRVDTAMDSLDGVSKNLRVLLVDDCCENRELIRLYLRDYPCVLQEAVDGEEAYSYYKNNIFDVVLMDIQMPVMDGLTATRLIRDHEKEEKKNPATIIALTAYAMKEDRNKSLQAGVTAHVTKPIKKVELWNILKKYSHIPSSSK